MRCPYLQAWLTKLQHEEKTDELQVSDFFYESEDDLHTKDEVINYDFNRYRSRSECESHVVGGGQETTTSPSRLNTITTVKETMSPLERDMVEMHLRLDGQVTQEDMSDLLSVIKDKIKQIENGMKADKQRHVSEMLSLSEENSALKKDLEETKRSYKKLEDSKTH